MRLRTIRHVLLLLCIGSPCAAQDPAGSPFACVESAVEVDIDRRPGLEFHALAGRPQISPTAREFAFDGSPAGFVRVQLAATVAEEPLGPASEAKLSVYVETAASPDDARQQRSQWWEVVPVSRPGDTRGRNASQALVFDAWRVLGCSGIEPGPGDCTFADVELATPDDNIPLIVIGFTRDRGGMNASNRTDARLLLDFRALPPRVAVTADCGYNEGTGVCGAVDSGMMPRSTLTCDWAPEAADLLCTETSDARKSRRDFYLLSDRLPPRRPSDVGSLHEAAAALSRRGIGQKVVVHGLGPVSWIDELTIDAKTTVMLMASAAGFYLAPRAKEGIGPIVGVRSRGLLDEAPSAAIVDRAPSEWTDEIGPLFRSRRIVRDRGVTVVQIVQIDGDPAGLPSALHWIGVERTAAGLSVDAVRLAGGGRYDHCGMIKVPWTITWIGPVRRPFQVRLRVQPPTVEPLDSEGDDARWEEASEGREIAGCVRAGSLRWAGTRFEMNMDRGVCKSPETPHHVRIDAGGRVSVGRPFERKE